jgi:hypothetical protein
VFRRVFPVIVPAAIAEGQEGRRHKRQARVGQKVGD